jgi:hypothetical protein
MSRKLIANAFCTMLPDDLTVVATITPVTAVSTKVKAVSAGVYLDGTSVTATVITVPTANATIPDPGPYTVEFSASSFKVNAEGKLVLREGDLTATISATPKIPASPSPIDYPIEFKIEITNAGQTKVLGE